VNVYCAFASVTCRLEKPVSTTSIIESNKIYSDTLSPHRYPTFIFFCDKWQKSIELSSTSENPVDESLLGEIREFRLSFAEYDERLLAVSCVIKIPIAEGPHPLPHRMRGLSQAGEALRINIFKIRFYIEVEYQLRYNLLLIIHEFVVCNE